MTAIDKIRNFSIIAHVDHGKSTLADRFLLDTHAISPREFREQMLDDMDLERERGITIKARAVRLTYKGHIFNLIDTPGHIDFTYEVSKSLAACEGVLLLVDAGQGIEAQTVTNFYLARERNLMIIPVLSKMDLPNAETERVVKELAAFLKVDASEVIRTSAKTGQGCVEVFDAIVSRVPPPSGKREEGLRALIFDSKYDSYKGVISYVRVFDGSLRKGERVRFVATGAAAEVEEIGFFDPHPRPCEELSVGEVGYVCANVRDVKSVKIGDTLTHEARPTAVPLAGYKEVQPMVFCGLYPLQPNHYEALREALAKLKLNDASFTFEPETSASLGFGFRCGFLGLLHMEIIQARLEREFELELIATAPSVAYRVVLTTGEVVLLDNPTKLPSRERIAAIEEPYIFAHLHVPATSIGVIMQLAQDRRGIYKSTDYLDPQRAVLIYELPLSEVLMDFYDRIKSLTKGYGSLDYELSGFQPAELVKLDILLNGDPVDALSTIVVRERAYVRGRALVKRLMDVIPRQLYEVAIQAAVGSRVIARETISALGKNVTGKCYGGDITRKRKLWEKQKEGKKRMKRIGKVDLPQEAFISILRMDEE